MPSQAHSEWGRKTVVYGGHSAVSSDMEYWGKGSHTALSGRLADRTSEEVTIHTLPFGSNTTGDPPFDPTHSDRGGSVVESETSVLVFRVGKKKGPFGIPVGKTTLSTSSRPSTPRTPPCNLHIKYFNLSVHANTAATELAPSPCDALRQLLLHRASRRRVKAVFLAHFPVPENGGVPASPLASIATGGAWL